MSSSVGVLATVGDVALNTNSRIYGSSSSSNLNNALKSNRSSEESNKYATFPRAKANKVDKYGFVVDHQKYATSSSLPNAAMNAEIGKRREMKWLKMLQHWDVWSARNHERLKWRCRKGIPSSVRPLVWQNLTGAVKLLKENPGLYEKLRKSEDSTWAYVIEKDIPRTFRHHCMFHDQDSDGQAHLLEVLLAYSVYDKKTGYNQAMAPVAAVLLMHMTPEETFWVLVSIVQFYLPGYYGEKMEAMQLDGMIFSELLESMLPHVSRHMQDHKIDPLMYIVEWMVCIYSRCLPFQSVLRIWDIFFCEGIKCLFRIGLAILKLVFPSPKELEGKDDYATTQALLHLPKELMTDSVLIPEALSLKLRGKDLKRIHKKIVKEHPELNVTRFTGSSKQ